jgi:hypothetical protein
MDAFEILVIILSVVLAIFLILSITLVIILIGIFKRIDVITQKAEHFASNIEEASEFFKNAAAPVTAGKMISNIIEWARKSSNK